MKVNAAESLRGLACLAVVFSHIALTFYPQLHYYFANTLPDFAVMEWIYNSPFGFFYSGNAAVFVFFVLSGYVLSLSMLKHNMTGEKLQNALAKRYPRLAIPALGSCLVVWAVLHIPVNGDQVSGWFRAMVEQDLSLWEVVKYGAFMPFVFGTSKYNPALWTMQIELFGSVVIYFFCYLQGLRLAQLVFFALMMILADLASQSLTIGVMCFFIGYFTYRSTVKINEGILVLVFLWGLYLAGYHDDSDSYAYMTRFFKQDMTDYCHYFGGILISVAVLKSRFLDRLLDQAPLVYLGKLSFSIYLLHFAVIYSIGVPLVNVLLQAQWSYGYASALAVIAILVVTFLAAAVYSRYVDDFAIRWSKRFAKWLKV